MAAHTAGSDFGNNASIAPSVAPDVALAVPADGIPHRDVLLDRGGHVPKEEGGLRFCKLDADDLGVTAWSGTLRPLPPIPSPPPSPLLAREGGDSAVRHMGSSRGERLRAKLQRNADNGDSTVATRSCHSARVEGRNWRGVDRPADAGLAARGVSLAEASKELLMERWEAKDSDSIQEHWAQECSPGPKRAARWGAVPGGSSQYSHAGETWWDKSTKSQHRRKGKFATSLLPSQKPAPLEETDRSTAPGTLEVTALGISEAGPTSEPESGPSCLCTRGACTCAGDSPCYRWPSGRPPYGAGNLPPLRGAEGGQSQSLGLSIAPPAPAQVGLPSWVQLQR